MKQLFKILFAVCIIAFAVSITAVSCGKTADPNNTNNANNSDKNSGDNNGGDGNGGGGTPAEPAIVIENVDASVVEVKNGTNIELKSSGFPTTAINANIANMTLATLATAPANSLKRAFDIVIKGTGGAAATGGLVLVDIGSRANANAFSTDAINKTLTSYTGTDLKEGLRNSAPRSADAANAEAAKAGWNIYAGFMDDTTPTSGAADATPFAFTATTGALATHPVLFCRTTVSTITYGGNRGGDTAQDTTVLTGGQKASCYVGSTGVAFTGFFGNAWLDTAASATFKKKFDIAVAGIKTDTKTLGTMGLTGGSTEFRNGLTGTEMTTLAAANESAFKKFSVSLVKDDGFSYTPPPSASITIENIDPSVVQLNGDTIELKASGFPKESWGYSVGVAQIPNARKAKRAFDIVITGGGDGAATGGLVLVDTGDRANANAFTLDALNKFHANPYTETELKEGLRSSFPRATDSSWAKKGWSIYSLFMNDAIPTSGATDVTPFAFTPTSGDTATHPVFFCRTVVATITAAYDYTGSAHDTTALTGGQRASCYIDSTGVTFAGFYAKTWLDTTASATFKKKFDIAVAGIRTDTKTIANIGLPGPDKAAAFRDGIDATEMTALTAANPSAFKKFSVSIVRDADFTYSPPAIAFQNFDANIAKLVAGTGGNLDTIKLKMSTYPPGSVGSATDNLIYFHTNTNITRIFDITIAGGVIDGSAATGGLVLVGTGDATSFSDLSEPTGIDREGTDAQRKEGIMTTLPATRWRTYPYNPEPGWSFFGLFLNETPPTTAAEDASPFAFTQVAAQGGGTVQPVMFCRATLSRIQDTRANNPQSVTDRQSFIGGQTAHCYITVKGSNFETFDKNTWINTAASNTFKKAFIISIGAIRTDESFVRNMGVPGATITQKINAIRDGLSGTELAAMAAANPSAFKRVRVTIVNDANF